MLQFIFSQIDSWCFREARPMGAVGGTAIETLFPPPASTLIGACRTLIGDSQNINWQAFAANKLPEMQTLLGNGEHTGQLQFNYPYLRAVINGKVQRLYPVPAILLKYEQHIVALKVGSKPVHCDLGHILLPELPKNVVAAKPLDSHWLTSDGFAQLLAGNLPAENEVLAISDLMTKENRLGIGRNNHTASVEQGMLYQTEHLRLVNPGQKNATRVEHLELVLEVKGLPAHIATQLVQNEWQVRLGGEGRLAHVSVSSALQPNTAKCLGAGKSWLYLTAPADLEGWLPENFTLFEQDGYQCWTGMLAEQMLTIKSFCAGKALKVGGWDSAKRQPKPVRSFVPAGACYLIECADREALARCLENHSFGKQTDFGFGAACLLPVFD